MKTTGILHDENNAYKLLNLTCDTLLLLDHDGVCEDLILRTEHPYIAENGTLLGKNIFEVFPKETVQELRPEFENVLINRVLSNKNYDLPAPDKMYYFKCIMQPYDEHHILCQYRDITRRSQMKKQLELFNHQLQETEKSAKTGHWIYDTYTGMIQYGGFADDRFHDGITSTFSAKEYIKTVHPDDVEAFKTLLNSPKKKLIDYRILLGEYIMYMRIKNTESRMEKGHRLTRGYVQNITDLIKKREELELATTAANNSNDNIYATYLDGRMIFANKLCRAQNKIDPDIDITQYKAYEILENIPNKTIWDTFVETLIQNNNSLKYVCKHPYPAFHVVASDCFSRIIKNANGEEVIWTTRQDISEQIRYEEALIKAKEKAEESDHLKSAFLSNMSHEIRTPLNAIVGFSNIIADTDDPEERKSYYKIIESNNERLLQLINEILDISKIESGIVEFNYTPILLNNLFAELLTTQQFNSPKAQLFFDPSPKETMLVTDKNRLVQVLANLITNAIKFTPDGEIHFGYVPKEKEIEIYVKDTGIGIAADKINRIFDRFVKVDAFAPGTGLGLSICKTLVQKLGGEISATSTIGVGTTMTFTLPYKQPINQQAAYPLKETSSALLRDAYNATILVVEDSPEDYQLIHKILREKYYLINAKTGLEAVELFHQYHPDMVLMDIKIPELDGLDATRNIREASPEIPIIAISAFAFQHEIANAFEAGCTDFISKPIDTNALLSSLAKYNPKKTKKTVGSLKHR